MRPVNAINPGLNTAPPRRRFASLRDRHGGHEDECANAGEVYAARAGLAVSAVVRPARTPLVMS